MSIGRFTLAQSCPFSQSSTRNGGGAYGWPYPGFTMLDGKENERAPVVIDKEQAYLGVSTFVMSMCIQTTYLQHLSPSDDFPLLQRI